jgi:hypothetical protein
VVISISGERLQRLRRAADEEQVGALARERAHDAAADTAAGPVDDRVLAFE